MSVKITRDNTLSFFRAPCPPNEIISRIVTYLRSEDLKTFAACSREFHAIALREKTQRSIDLAKKELEHFLRVGDLFDNQVKPDACLVAYRDALSRLLNPAHQEHLDKLASLQRDHAINELLPRLQLEIQEKIESNQASLQEINQLIKDTILRSTISVIQRIVATSLHQNPIQEAFEAAAKAGALNLLEALIDGQKHAPVNYINNTLYTAVQNGRYDIIQYLIERFSFHKEVLSNAVIYASGKGHERPLKKILFHVSLSEMQRGFAVCTAAKSKDYNIVSVLLENGAIDQQSRSQTAIDLIKEKRWDLVKKVLNSGKLTQRYREACIYEALNSGGVDISIQLLAEGNISAVSKKRIFDLAQQQGNSQIIEALNKMPDNS